MSQTPTIQKKRIELPHQAPFPRKLFVETTTRCNMTCPMCVKQTEHSTIVNGLMTQETFAALAPAFTGLEALILNGVGESLLHPRLETFIAAARSAMPDSGWIGFQSNGLLLDEKKACALAEAGLDRICISLDAVSPEIFRRLREGGEIGAVARAFAALRQADKSVAGSRLRGGVECVVMQDNLHQLPEVLRYAAQQGAQFAIVSQLIPYAAGQQDQIAYGTDTDAAVELFERWRVEGERQGIDLRTVSLGSWGISGIGDPRVSALVEGMKSEAREKEIFLNVKEIRDRLGRERNSGELAEVFAQAREIADNLGMELFLPARRPQQERRCAFVEEGGAFVSWNGEVHPCYNLWHGYRCYLNGWERTVRPQVFGSLERQSLAEIWNAPDFRRFRDNVLRYDHSNCISCTVAPCDYVEAEDFQQDCYLKTEPCGTCLWSMGILQCLQ
jgi:putative metalloenzyme radical SAM/SPASM domain maturase